MQKQVNSTTIPLSREALSHELLQIIQLFHARGWSMATSTNYSFRNLSPDENTYTISKSGVDKSQFKITDFMQINAQGNALEAYQSFKPSAETLLHTLLYEQDKSIQAVLHTHSPEATVLSQRYAAQGSILLSQYEMIKGIAGNSTHDTNIELPIFANSQDMETLSQEIALFYENTKHPSKGFLLAGHGLYAWGKNIAEAKRHIETYEFLLRCEYLKLAIH
ncbi:MAG: methylthioribulose 1-phosphate dehydratase [Cytophagales bacterium]|nr:MAG: methylthioribulose 1-phosphate dehydratase [Cytophagales bacterium]